MVTVRVAAAAVAAVPVLGVGTLRVRVTALSDIGGLDIIGVIGVVDVLGLDVDVDMHIAIILIVFLVFASLRLANRYS